MIDSDDAAILTHVNVSPDVAAAATRYVTGRVGADEVADVLAALGLA